MTLGTALKVGYESKELLDFLTRTYPNIGRKISQAQQSGYDINKIVEMFSGMSLDDVEDFENSTQIQSSNPWINADRSLRKKSTASQFKKGAKIAGAVAAPLGAYLAYKTIKPYVDPFIEQTAGTVMDKLGSLTGEPEPVEQVTEVTNQVAEQIAPTADPAESYKIFQDRRQDAIIDALATQVEPEQGVTALQKLYGKNFLKELETQYKKPAEQIIGEAFEFARQKAAKPQEEQPVEPPKEVISEEKAEEMIGPQTGKPYSFEFVRNTQASQDLGPRFGQDIEPHGRYMREGKAKHVENMPGMESGKIKFKNPLVIPWGEAYGEEGNWKNVLSKKYRGKKGKELSQAIRDEGYDGIITTETDKWGLHTSEIVDLTSFSESKKKTEIDTTLELPKVDPKTAKKKEVVTTKDGEIGTIEGISGTGALVNIDGKVKKMKFEDLQGESELIKEAKIVIDPTEVPESERSAALGFVLTAPDRSSIMISHGPSGKFYRYYRKDKEAIDEDIVERLRVGQTKPVSTGKSYMGWWDADISDSRGTIAYHDLTQMAQREGEPDDPSKPLLFEEFENTFTHGYIKKYLDSLKKLTSMFSRKKPKPKKPKKKK